jgi:hypothetical protein
MPTRRTPLNRSRRPVINAETLRPFTELENVPLRHRRSEEFKRRSRELAARLNLSTESFCCGTPSAC